LAIALVHLGPGETNQAVDALERTVAARYDHLMSLPVEMKRDPYRTDPRFVDMLDRCACAA
jgi:hypothetical protein